MRLSFIKPFASRQNTKRETRRERDLSEQVKSLQEKQFKAVKQPNGPAQFPEPTSLGPRKWGNEILLYTSPGNYTFKRIEMHKGAKGGLQYHHKKDEGGVVITGELLVRFDRGDGNLSERICGPGAVFHFPQGSVHQGEALTDVVYIEVSTPFFNDRVHCESEYGIETEEGGLPSTRLEDVVAA